jgi:hypothetical protein
MTSHHHTMSALAAALAVALLLLATRAQEPDQASPSVADAARAARERRNSGGAKNILTNDDVGRAGGSADDAAVPALEPGIRAQIERSYPVSPTSSDLERQMTQLMIYSKAEPPERMFAKFEDSAIHKLEQVDFPGKRDWEAQLNDAVQRWMQESGQASKRIEEILNENREVLASRDPAGIRKVRAQWLDAVVPSAAWQSRVQQLVDEAKRAWPPI